MVIYVLGCLDLELDGGSHQLEDFVLNFPVGESLLLVASRCSNGRVEGSFLSGISHVVNTSKECNVGWVDCSGLALA